MARHQHKPKTEKTHEKQTTDDDDDGEERTKMDAQKIKTHT